MALLVAAVVALAAGATHRVLAASSASLTGGSPLANAGPLAHGSSTGRDRCTLKTLRGSYVFTASGFNIVGGVAQPKAIVEVIDFDGHGSVDVTGGAVSINGTITQGLSGVGVYTLDAECRGTLVFSSGPSFDLVVEPRGDQAVMIQTNPGTVFQGTVTRFSR